jgi:hypothetical protein
MLPMLEWLFSWEVVSVMVGLLVSIGLGVLALDDFKLAKLFFLSAAADAVGGMVMWGVKTDVPPWVRNGIVFVSVGLIGVLLVQSFRYVDRKEVAKKGNSSFSVDFGTQFVNVNRNGGWMWVSYNVDTLSPIHLAHCLTITNTSESTPAMIKAFSIDVAGNDNNWVKMVRLPSGFIFSTNNPWDEKESVQSLELSDGFLLDSITNRSFGPKESARGWILYGAPPNYDSYPRPLRFRVRIKDMADREFIEEIKYADKPSEDRLQMCGIRAVPTTVKLSKYKLRFYGDQLLYAASCTFAVRFLYSRFGEAISLRIVSRKR